LLWDVLINRHTSDSSGFAAMIAPLSALSNGKFALAASKSALEAVERGHRRAA
jgi:hypothetical protein